MTNGAPPVFATEPRERERGRDGRAHLTRTAHGICATQNVARMQSERPKSNSSSSSPASSPRAGYVSVTGVTGSTALVADEAGARAAQLQETVGRPVVIGFGIDSRAKARAAAMQAAGVVVGTVLVRTIEDGKTPAERRSAVESVVRGLRAGVDEASE